MRPGVHHLAEDPDAGWSEGIFGCAWGLYSTRRASKRMFSDSRGPTRVVKQLQTVHVYDKSCNGPKSIWASGTMSQGPLEASQLGKGPQMGSLIPPASMDEKWRTDQQVIT